MPKKFVLITGTSSGIGRASALRLVREEFDVIATVRSEVDAGALRQDAGSDGGRLHPILMDVAIESSLDRGTAEIQSLVDGEGLFSLVNNAGICAVGPVECISLAALRGQFDVNFFGAVAVTQRMLPLLRIYNSAHGAWGARIINMISITGEVPTPFFGAYSACKFALLAMTDALRMELFNHSIHVSGIIPGCIQSEIWKKEREGVDASLADPKSREMYGPILSQVAEQVFKSAKNSLPADGVAQVIYRCLHAKSPKPIYRIGREAYFGAYAKRWIPNRLFNYMMGKKLGVR